MSLRARAAHPALAPERIVARHVIIENRFSSHLARAELRRRISLRGRWLLFRGEILPGIRAGYVFVCRLLRAKQSSFACARV